MSEQDGPQRLAHLDRAAQVCGPDQQVLISEPRLRQPAAECVRVDERLPALLAVERVDEAAEQLKPSRSLLSLSHNCAASRP